MSCEPITGFTRYESLLCWTKSIIKKRFLKVQALVSQTVGNSRSSLTSLTSVKQKTKPKSIILCEKYFRVVQQLEVI